MGVSRQAFETGSCTIATRLYPYLYLQRTDRPPTLMGNLRCTLQPKSCTFALGIELLPGLPVKFYYKYAAHLNAPDEISPEIDAAKFGSIFHHAAEHIYKDLTTHGKVINQETIENLLKNEVRLQDYVDKGFKELFSICLLKKNPPTMVSNLLIQLSYYAM